MPHNPANAPWSVGGVANPGISSGKHARDQGNGEGSVKLGRYGPLAWCPMLHHNLQEEPNSTDGGAGLYFPLKADHTMEWWAGLMLGICHVPTTLAGTLCTALVDTGSTATLMRPDVVLVGTQWEKTTVQLRTVTGDLAPMRGKGRVTLNVGGLSVTFPVWVAEVQDSCILRLDFLRFVRCLLDLGDNTLSFPGDPTVKMTSPTQTPRPH